jgi:hypothetical protein
MQTIGSQGRLLRIGSYLTAGTYTWTKQPDVGFILVKVVGGGGGGDGGESVGNGGQSKFGTHCTANGGTGGGPTSAGGAGGTASGGDININGQSGYFEGQPGNIRLTIMGQFGYGGTSSIVSNGGAGGGAGGYCEKIIYDSSLSSTETVTVGAAGSGGTGGEIFSGGSGAVFIYEYSK